MNKLNYIDCIVIGDVFVDIIIKKDFFKINIVRGGVSYCDQIVIGLGGIGNVAVGLSKLGGRVQFIGKAGNDILSRLYQKNLIKENVRTKLIFDKFHSTGIVLTFVDEKGERSFLIFRGANDFLLPEEIDLYKADITRSKYLFISGYSLANQPQRKAILKAVKIAKSSDCKVIFDPAAHNLIKQKRLIFEKILNLCDIIVPNLEEAKALTGYDKIEDILTSLSKKVPLVALKMGERGCIIATSNKRLSCPGKKVNCVDSTGAGDAFASALIYGLSKGLSLKTTAKLANWYASRVIEKLGSRSFPSRDEVRNF